MTLATATNTDLKAVVVSQNGTYLVKPVRSNFMWTWTRKLDQATQFTPEEALRIAVDQTSSNNRIYSAQVLPRTA